MSRIEGINPPQPDMIGQAVNLLASFFQGSPWTDIDKMVWSQKLAVLGDSEIVLQAVHDLIDTHESPFMPPFAELRKRWVRLNRELAADRSRRRWQNNIAALPAGPQTESYTSAKAAIAELRAQLEQDRPATRTEA